MMLGGGNVVVVASVVDEPVVPLTDVVVVGTGLSVVAVAVVVFGAPVVVVVEVVVLEVVVGARVVIVDVVDVVCTGKLAVSLTELAPLAPDRPGALSLQAPKIQRIAAQPVATARAR